MKTAIISTIALLVGSAAAQGASLNGLPPCATSCLNLQGLQSSGCSSLDITCICQQKSFVGDLSCCVSQKCDPTDQQATINFANGICKQANVQLPQHASCAPGASSSVAAASSTAGSSSAAPSASSTASSSVTGTTSAAATAATTVTSSGSGSMTMTSSPSGSGSATAASAGSSSSAASTGGAAVHGQNIGAAGGLIAALVALL